MIHYNSRSAPRSRRRAGAAPRWAPINSSSNDNNSNNSNNDNNNDMFG